MAYSKTVWENKPSTASKVSADNMNKIENGIYNNSINIGELTNLNTSNKDNLVSSINEVNTNLSGTILWTNPNPTSEISSNTDITLLSNDYDMLLIIWRLSTTNNFMQSNILTKGYGTRLYYGNNYRPITRNSDTSYTIGIASDSSAPSAIPLYVIGYKTGLF